MKLYENVAIGNFLYGLGFAVGHRVEGNDFPTIINLLQQTPDDPLLGDVLLQAPGLLRIFEFKEHKNSNPKEKNRHTKLAESLANNAALSKVSRAVHWFIETAPSEKTFVSRIVPYLDAFPKTKTRSDFASFINETADAVIAGNDSVTPDDMAAYLAHLLFLQEAESIGSGGLIVKMSTTGEIAYCELTSILELSLSRRTVIELRQEQMLEQHLEHELTLERTKSKGLGHGR